MGLFDLQPTVTLYDLTNTYFEGEASAQPQARRGTLEGEAQRLSAADPGPDARRQRLRAPLAGLRRQRQGTPHAGRHARGASGADPGALVVIDPRRRHRRLHHVAARQRLPLSGRQPRAPPAIRRRCRRCRFQTQSKQTVHLHKVVSHRPPTRCACTATRSSGPRRNAASSSVSPPRFEDGPDPAQRRAGATPEPTSASARSGSASGD